MTAAQAAMVQAGALTERIRHVTAVLSAAIGSDDFLTAGYAAAELSGLADHVEEVLFTARHGARDAGLTIVTSPRGDDNNRRPGWAACRHGATS